MAEVSTPSVQEAPGISSELWDEAGWLPCELSVELPIPEFRVRDLLRLTVGSVVETLWKNGHDVPLHANKRQIGWIEFEAVDESVAVRVSELC